MHGEQSGAGPASGRPAFAAAAFAGTGEVRKPRASLPIRSAERRRWAAGLLESPAAGLVVYGLGGIGKSRLAAAIADRIGQLEPNRITVIATGELSADLLLARLAAALRTHWPVAGGDGVDSGHEALAAAARADLSWDLRLAQLREHVLGRVPVLLLLDDFDDNLVPVARHWDFKDAELAGLLASWCTAPAAGKLLVTSRAEFALPGADPAVLDFHQLGPLTRSAAAELAKAMPVCGRLAGPDFDRAWRSTGGHPIALEYLDRVLAAGDIRFQDLALRVDAAIQATTGHPVMATGPQPPTELSSEAAGMIAMAAGDALLDMLCERLSTGARALLTGASVHRLPVPADSLLTGTSTGDAGDDGQAGPIAECAAAWLVTTEPGGVLVHRWTAAQLHRGLAESGRNRELASAYRRAADFCWSQVRDHPAEPRAVLEAKYHLAQAGALSSRDQPVARSAVARGRRRARVALAAAAVAMIVALGGLAARHIASVGGTRPGDPARAGMAGATVRDHVSAWIATQVSGGTIVACDPAMCAALAARGFPALSLSLVRPQTGQTWVTGSGLREADLVVATATVRHEFGSNLASVYAPEVVASFGAGSQQVQVRAVAANGAAAYLASLAADLAARKAVGSQLLHNPSVGVSPAARTQLVAGQVDSRLLIMLATMAAAEPIQVRSFGDPSPGAGAGTPLRSAEITVAGQATGTGLASLLTFARAQHPPYQPARDIISHGGLLIEFAAPSPLGLLPATAG